MKIKKYYSVKTLDTINSMSKLSDEEILDFLMTSDYNEGLTLNELKFLLMKFRNFYRVLSSTVSSYIDRIETLESQNKEIVLELNISKKNIDSILRKLENDQNKLKNILSKKLSWKERLTGKLNQIR
jgi:predicted RNase H-like nuclease (RuvC/YqgF family)